MAVDFKTFVSVAPIVLDAGYPVLIRGRHGIGKSELAYQIAKDKGLPVVERRASQMTEGDLLGLPDSDEMEFTSEQGASKTRKVTTWNAPDWFATACERPVLLFLDEVDRATTEVRQGLFELTDSRKLNGWHLHPETIIIAAVNGGEHGAQYQVGEMDPAELDRWTVYDVEPSVEDWLSWANGKVDKVVWDFINQNRNHLEHGGDFEPNKVYPSRRSWARFSKAALTKDLFSENANREVMYVMACSFVGFEAAVSLRDFISNYEYQVKIEEILMEGKIEKVAKFDINEHAAMVEKLQASGYLKEELTDVQAQNLGEYFLVMPAEIGMKLWSVLGSSDSIVQNVVKVHGIVSKKSSRSVKEHLVQILTGEK